MDFSAVMTREEVAALFDENRNCAYAIRLVKSAGSSEDGKSDANVFLDSIKVKNTLDRFEEQARAKPSWRDFSVLINCELQLYLLNKDTPLRHNPFLSHWVEAIQRLESTPKSLRAASAEISSYEICMARAGLIKELLAHGNVERFASASPRTLYASLVKIGEQGNSDLAPYIQMLEEEGVYERSSTFTSTDFTAAGSVEETSGSETPQRKQDTDIILAVDTPHESKQQHKQSWKQTILSQLEAEPEAALSALAHLPIELSYLDFLTNLLQDGILDRLSIDPAPVVRNYLQHALRLAEKMGEPPRASSSSSSSQNLSRHSSSGDGEDGDGSMDYGREAQARAVKLLLLFMRNLIRKALVQPEEVYFEIQEVCVRYIWIKEVREFKGFVEEGRVVEGDGEVRMGIGRD